MAKKLTKLKKD